MYVYRCLYENVFHVCTVSHDRILKIWRSEKSKSKIIIKMWGNIKNFVKLIKKLCTNYITFLWVAALYTNYITLILKALKFVFLLFLKTR